MFNREGSAADPPSVSGNETGSACRDAPQIARRVADEVESLAEQLHVRRRLLDTVLLPVGAGWSGLPGVVAPSGVLFHGPDAALARPLATAIAAAYEVPSASVDVVEVLADPGVSTPDELAGALLRVAGPGPVVIELIGVDRVRGRRYVGSDEDVDREAAGAGLLAAGLVELRGDEPRHQPLLVATTDVPWDIDDDLLVRGALDRSVFVPPPDLGRRRRVLTALVGDGADLDEVAVATEGWSVADLNELVAGHGSGGQGSDPEALLARAAAEIPRVAAWMTRAREMVDFASDRRRFDDLIGYLGRYRLS